MPTKKGRKPIADEDKYKGLRMTACPTCRDQGIVHAVPIGRECVWCKLNVKPGERPRVET